MSTTTPAGLNGRMKKTLAFQLDRLDSILDGLAEALNGAMADAVKETVGQSGCKLLDQGPGSSQSCAHPGQEQGCCCVSAGF